METEEFDEVADHGDVTAHRARAKVELDRIAEQTKRALSDVGIDTPVFFLLPNSGSALLTFGTITDPPDDQWEQVRDIVSAIVRKTVGLDRTRCREVICATTGSLAAPMLMAPLQHSGAEFR